MTGALLSSDCHVEVDSGSPSEERILSMVAEREVLREEGRFEEAEEVHDQLDNMGVKILAKDTFLNNPATENEGTCCQEPLMSCIVFLILSEIFRWR